MVWRLIALTIINVIACLLGVGIAMREYDPNSPVTRAVWICLLPVVALPLGWLLALVNFPENSPLGVVLLNAPFWAASVEWLLQRFVDRPIDPGAE